ncbi:hypothetical protein [uncultured Lutibacter sp.]|uniref:hypothetical protein n=1 Tax=uncultured Lutibacter sp. TaxID=437739 RepID=UPI00262C9968|nr:hypothetical protein [uncultured Lutibacter sp.]
MKKPTLLVLSLFILQSINSQMLKEVISFHENGNPKEINFKNENLKIVKTQEFDFEKNLISEFNYNPKTGILDGDFKDFNNIGFYNNGELNCTNCKISFHNGTQLRGDFKDGRPYGKIEIYKVSEIQNRQTNNYTSYLLSLEYGRRIQYDEMIGTGEYIYEKRLELEYNSNGNLDGIYQINSQTKLYFDNGKMIGFTINNFENQSIKKDSIFRDNKIWLSNNVFKKNTGWIDLNWDEFRNPWSFTYDIPKEYGEFFGGENTTLGGVSYRREIGIVYKNSDKSFWKKKHYSEENLIALIRLYLESMKEPYYHNGIRYIEFYYLSKYGEITNQFESKDHPNSGEYSILNFFEVENFLVNILKDKIFEDFYYYELGKYKSFKHLITSNKLGDKKHQVELERIQIKKMVEKEINYFVNNIKQYFRVGGKGHEIKHLGNQINTFEVEKFPEYVIREIIEQGGLAQFYNSNKQNWEKVGIGFLFIDEGFNSDVYWSLQKPFIYFNKKFYSHQKEFQSNLNYLIDELGIKNINYNEFTQIENIKLSLNKNKNDYDKLIISGRVISKPKRNSSVIGGDNVNKEVISAFIKLYKSNSPYFKLVLSFESDKVRLTDRDFNVLYVQE